jgi:hypothetical protein
MPSDVSNSRQKPHLSHLNVTLFVIRRGVDTFSTCPEMEMNCPWVAAAMALSCSRGSAPAKRTL